jgi:hypothetical protein
MRTLLSKNMSSQASNVSCSTFASVSMTSRVFRNLCKTVGRSSMGALIKNSRSKSSSRATSMPFSKAHPRKVDFRKASSRWQCNSTLGMCFKSS